MRLVRLLDGFKDKRAKAVCSIGFCIPENTPVVFQGITHGRLVGPKGRSNFGWDPIFLPNNSKNTFAQMSVSEKNKISHRKKAFVKLRDYLLKKAH